MTCLLHGPGLVAYTALYLVYLAHVVYLVYLLWYKQQAHKIIPMHLLYLTLQYEVHIESFHCTRECTRSTSHCSTKYG